MDSAGASTCGTCMGSSTWLYVCGDHSFHGLCAWFRSIAGKVGLPAPSFQQRMQQSLKTALEFTQIWGSNGDINRRIFQPLGTA